MALSPNSSYVDVALADSELPNHDLLAWFSDEEKDVCPSCGQRTSVTLPDVTASFCLACGAVSIDGVRIDRELRLTG